MFVKVAINPHSVQNFDSRSKCKTNSIINSMFSLDHSLNSFFIQYLNNNAKFHNLLELYISAIQTNVTMVKQCYLNLFPLRYRSHEC